MAPTEAGVRERSLRSPTRWEGALLAAGRKRGDDSSVGQETPDGSRPPRPEPRGEAEFARIRAPGGESAGGTMVAVVYADRSVRPSLPPPPDGPTCALPFRRWILRPRCFFTPCAVPHLYLPPPPSPITPLMPHYLVLCPYAVRPGYAYPSALLWVDLLINKVGPCQTTTSRRVFPDHPDQLIKRRIL